MSFSPPKDWAAVFIIYESNESSFDENLNKPDDPGRKDGAESFGQETRGV